MAVLNQIGAVFVPVSDIESARDWYCRLLGLEPVEILFGHLAVLPMREGSGLVLDGKDFAGPHDRQPLFHFDTRDLHAAHAQLEQLGAEALGPVTDGAFFTFKDPDGNLLMVADVPPAPRMEPGR
jgi:catechol 2,3-dioxygenase-like lactoylglutathione lyase family enzyme